MTGEELRGARVAAGVSQEVLAAAAGYNPVYLGMLENGHVRIGERAGRLLLSALERLSPRRTSPDPTTS